MTANKTKKNKKKDKRGKWSLDPWIRVLQILSEMPINERRRCIKATADFYDVPQ